MRMILLAAVAALVFSALPAGAHADGVFDYGRVVRALNGSPVNPALPVRTKLGTDGRLMGEYPSGSGAVWRDIDRQPWFVMPLKSDVKYYTRDGGEGAGSFSRSSTAYYRNYAGAWTLADADEPRFGFANMSTADGWHWTKAGYLDEDSGTNYALYSSAPASQTITLNSTGYYTLWVEGSGSCAIAAGNASGTGFGTASEVAFVTVNITGTGTVNLTVTGGLTRFQLEKWYHPTSWIPTTSVPVTRAADVLTVPSAGLVDDLAGTAAIDYYSQQRKGVTPSGFVKWYLLVDFGVSRYPISLGSKDAKVRSNEGASNVDADFEWGQKTYTFVSRWGGTTRKVYNKTQNTSATGTYDGSWDTGSAMEVGRLNGANGYVSNLRIWKGVRLKDSEVAGL